MFEAIHREFIRVGSYSNVATSPDEYDIQSDLIGKIRAFTGVPGEKLLQGRFIFNSPILEEFYRNREQTDTQFIVLPKKDKWPTDQILERENEPARFAAENFQKFYENDNYLVLSVPTTRGSSPTRVGRNISRRNLSIYPCE